MTTIGQAELDAARRQWGDALVAISTAFDEQGLVAATEFANQALDAVYGYAMGPVLFKPTMASGEQTFRPTRDGALSYFVGHNPDYPLDGGFGLKGWRRVESKRRRASSKTTSRCGWVASPSRIEPAR